MSILDRIKERFSKKGNDQELPEIQKDQPEELKPDLSSSESSWMLLRVLPHR
jgi:hypothetical protein